MGMIPVEAPEPVNSPNELTLYGGQTTATMFSKYAKVLKIRKRKLLIAKTKFFYRPDLWEILRLEVRQLLHWQIPKITFGILYHLHFPEGRQSILVKLGVSEILLPIIRFFKMNWGKSVLRDNPILMGRI